MWFSNIVTMIQIDKPLSIREDLQILHHALRFFGYIQRLVQKVTMISNSYGTLRDDVTSATGAANQNSRYTRRSLQYRPGLAPSIALVRPQPKDYLLEVLFVIFFCFFPLGFVALYYANKVKICYQNNDFIGSYAASKVVKILLIISVIFGVCIWVLGILAIINLRHKIY